MQLWVERWSEPSGAGPVVGSAPMSASPTRRQVLVAAAVGGVAACTGERDTRAADRDAALRQAAVQRERDLLAAYDAALSRTTPDAALLQALRAEHAAHLAVLDPLAAGPSPAPRPAAVDRTRLTALERAAATAHAAAALSAGRALAGVLASCSASEASHAVALA